MKKIDSFFDKILSDYREDPRFSSISSEKAFLFLHDNKQDIDNKKAALSQYTKPLWKTNCNYGNIKGSKTVPISMQNPNQLSETLMDLVLNKNAYEEVKAIFGWTGEYTHQGYTYSNWLHDIMVRMEYVVHTNKFQNLLSAERELDSYLSREFKVAEGLEKISKMLDNL